MTNGQKAEVIKQYVDEACKPFLTAYKDVINVEYRNNGTSGFVKVTTAFGFANYFDVTGLECGQICQLLSAMMCNGRPKMLVKDREAKREIEKLFR